MRVNNNLMKSINQRKLLNSGEAREKVRGKVNIYKLLTQVVSLFVLLLWIKASENWLNLHLFYSIHSFLIEGQILLWLLINLFVYLHISIESYWIWIGELICSSGERSIFTHSDNDNIITEAFCSLTKLLSHIHPFLFSTLSSCQFHCPSQTPFPLASFLSKTKAGCPSFWLQYCVFQ